MTAASDRVFTITNFGRVGVCAAILALASCTMRPGGSMKSLDEFTYHSTPFEPKTVKVIDVRDLSEVWSMDVPVRQELTIRFFDNQSDDPHNPALMRWALRGENDLDSPLKNKIAVPPEEVRRVVMELRRAPELAPESAPPPLTAPPPTTQAQPEPEPEPEPEREPESEPTEPVEAETVDAAPAASAPAEAEPAEEPEPQAEPEPIEDLPEGF